MSKAIGNNRMKNKYALTLAVISESNDENLSNCLRSIADQELAEIELYVIDRRENCGEKPEKFIKKLLPKKDFIYLNMKYTERYAVKNYILERAKGEYLMIVGDDICFLPGGLAKVYDRAKRTEADVVTVRAAASVFEGKEYSGKWTAAEHSFTKAPVFEAKDTGGRGFLFCHGWMGDKLFRVDFLREKGLHFSAVRAFESVPFVFTAILLGKNTVCEAALYTQELQCIKYQKNPNIALIDCQIVMLMLEERLKAYGLFDAYEKAFRTWCIEFAVWFYQTIKGEEKEKFRHVLKGNIEPWLKVTEGGRYFTVKRLYKYCELCSEDDEKTVQRKIKAYDSAKTIISIWGCCVSRQFLNLEPDAFYVNGYMFQNPIHLTYDGLPISKNKIPFSVFESVKTYGIWQKSSYLNFNRNVLDYFKTHKADYLLIDIADIRFERYRCVEREDGLRSWLVDGKHVEACLDECLKRGINIKIENITYNFFKNREHIISKESWYRIVSKFVADIKQLYDVDKVIFNRVVCSEQYAENYVLIPFENDIRKYNILIPEVEELILNNLQGCHVIPASKNVYADAKHSLGLSPMHYCKTYEEYKMKALKKIVYEHASNAEIQTLCDEYDKKLVYELESLTKQE